MLADRDIRPNLLSNVNEHVVAAVARIDQCTVHQLGSIIYVVQINNVNSTPNPKSVRMTASHINYTNINTPIQTTTPGSSNTAAVKQPPSSSRRSPSVPNRRLQRHMTDIVSARTMLT